MERSQIDLRVGPRPLTRHTPGQRGHNFSSYFPYVLLLVNRGYRLFKRFAHLLRRARDSNLGLLDCELHYPMEGPAVVQAVEEVGLPSARQEVAAPRETTTFTGLVPHTQARDVRPGNRPYSAVDVTGMRERLVRAVSPLQTVEEARGGRVHACSLGGPPPGPPHPCTGPPAALRKVTPYPPPSPPLPSSSPRLRGQSRRTETYTEERTQSAENSVTHGLDQRLASTLELRTHHHHAINNTIDELALQNTMKSRLQVALFALELPERNNEECIHIRRFRFSVDRTRDPVVFALNKEKETLSTGRSLLTQTLKETEAQISRLLEVKRLLEHDWSDKQEAFQLDHFAAKLANDRVKAQFKAVSAALNEGVSVPDTWRLRSKEHLDVCRREITTGSQLRGAADQV
ncbi:tektin-4-like [Scylla paramamosain]|uniref:tektin-4-like n=1 Tax=Scylla paramamosain TaxID=85552 RepID=UPI003082B94E